MYTCQSGYISLHFWRAPSDKESYCRDISFSLLTFNSCLYFNFLFVYPLKIYLHVLLYQLSTRCITNLARADFPF